MPNKRCYRTKEVAEILKISENEVRRRLNCGELKGRKSKRRQRWLIYPDQEAFSFLNDEDNSLSSVDEIEEEPIYRLIKDTEHEELFAEYLDSVEESLYIATANFKNVHINSESLVQKLNDLFFSEVEVHVICARMQSSEEKYFDYIVCPRNHMKMFIFDKKAMYIGSANLTPAAIEDRTYKAKKTNNHEAGIFTTDKKLISEALVHFEEARSIDDCSICTIQDCDIRDQ